MDRIDVIKKKVEAKKLAIADNDTISLAKSNKSLNNIINDGIKKAQKTIEKENRYKGYLNNNREYIIQVTSINTYVDTMKEAMGLINQVDFRHIFGIDNALNEVFKCDFIKEKRRISFACDTEEEADQEVMRELIKYPGVEATVSGYERFGMYVKEIIFKHEEAEAWIVYNKSRNKYLYNVGSNKAGKYYTMYAFDMLDLYQIFKCCDIRKAKQELCELLGIRVREIEEIKAKYERCKDDVGTYLTKEKFPILHELIGKHIPKLMAVLEEGIDKVYYAKNYDGNYVFSSSMEHLAIRIGKEKSTITPVINTLAILGLIEKVDVNSGIFEKHNRNDITNFNIPEYIEPLFQKAEEIAKIILYSGERVTASSFTYAICKDKFGEKIANKIFKDKVIKAKAS